MARTVIVTSLGHKPWSGILNGNTPIALWDTLRAGYEAASSANKIKLLTSLIITQYQARKDLADYIAELETYFHRLAIMGLPMAKEIQIAILLVSVMNEELFKRTVVALKTVDGDKATWGSECSRLLEELCFQRMMK